MKKALKIIYDVVFWVVILAVVGVSLAFALNQNPEKDIFGYRFYNVLSASMEPKISVGDLVVVKIEDGENVQNGDIITYYPVDDSSTTVTHRVISTIMKDGEVLIETKGDAVDQADPMFSAENVIGVVKFNIPFIGGMLKWIQENIMISIAVVAVIIALLIGTSFMKPKRDVNAESENIID